MTLDSRVTAQRLQEALATATVTLDKGATLKTTYEYLLAEDTRTHEPALSRMLQF